jgi:hypothetical protein
MELPAGQSADAGREGTVLSEETGGDHVIRPQGTARVEVRHRPQSASQEEG